MNSTPPFGTRDLSEGHSDPFLKLVADAPLKARRLCLNQFLMLPHLQEQPLHHPLNSDDGEGQVDKQGGIYQVTVVQ